MSIWLVVFISLCAFGTATISAVVGMGGGIVLLTVLILFLQPSVVVPLHGLVQLVSNSTRAFFLRRHIKFKFLMYYSIGVPFGALTSVFLIKKLDSQLLPQVFICILIFYVVFKPKKLPALVLPQWGFIFLGYIASTISLLVGATGPLLAPFFLRPDFKKEEIIATKASVQFVTHLLKIPAFLYLGFPYLEYAGFSVALLVATILGTRMGIHLLGKLNEKTFVKIFKVALFLVGIRLAYKISLEIMS